MRMLALRDSFALLCVWGKVATFTLPHPHPLPVQTSCAVG
jgi:hypothetical protein